MWRKMCECKEIDLIYICLLYTSVLLLGGCAEEKKTDVRWATFNNRYDNTQDSLNNWEYRKDRVCQFIKDHELDIIGMQEVLHSQFQDLRAGLPEYDGCLLYTSHG